MRILFFSASGNTRAFVKKLADYAEEMHQTDQSNPLIESLEITDFSPFEEETEPFVAFVPTYLDGGNGMDSGTNEIITNTLGEYIAFSNNKNYLKGVIGSGNRNFNWQYCLTAKQYAEKFQVPFLADYELRGTPADVKRIYQVLKETFK